MNVQCPLCRGSGAIHLSEFRARGLEVIATLTYREREILKLRYGIGDGYTYTLEEVGKIFKVTRERVRQVEAKAVRKLQHPVRFRKLEALGCRDVREFLRAMTLPEECRNE